MITTVDRIKLITTLKTNRDQHHAVWLEAVEGYHAKAKENLESLITSLKGAHKKPVPVNLHLTVPEDHTKDYDKVIGLLEMSTEDTIRLSDQDYEWFVLDDWGWKNSWMYANAGYSATASKYTKSQVEEDEAIFA